MWLEGSFQDTYVPMYLVARPGLGCQEPPPGRPALRLLLTSCPTRQFPLPQVIQSGRVSTERLRGHMHDCGQSLADAQRRLNNCDVSPSIINTLRPDLFVLLVGRANHVARYVSFETEQVAGPSTLAFSSSLARWLSCLPPGNPGVHRRPKLDGPIQFPERDRRVVDAAPHAAAQP